MNSPDAPNPSPRDHAFFTPVVIGTVFGTISAVGYTAANVCLRAVVDCDPIWVSAVKAVPTVLLVGPWLFMLIARSQAIIPSARHFAILLAAATFGQLAGNVAFQYALGVVGIALTVALTFGAMIVSGVVIGRWVLRESVTQRMVVASLILIASIVVLSLGAGQANRSIAVPAEITTSSWGTLHVIGGVAAACLSGFAYCVLGSSIRHAVFHGTPYATVLIATGLVGMIVLGALSYLQMGLAGMEQTESGDLAYMVLAGVCNAVAFAALIKALHLTGLVFVNALNASQTAMAAIAGVFFFQEAITLPMLCGVALTMFGLLMMRRRRLPRTPSPEMNEEKCLV